MPGSSEVRVHEHAGHGVSGADAHKEPLHVEEQIPLKRTLLGLEGLECARLELRHKRGLEAAQQNPQLRLGQPGASEGQHTQRLHLHYVR